MSPVNCDTVTLCGSGFGISNGCILVSIPSIILAGAVFIVRVTLDPPTVIVLSIVIIFVPALILSIFEPSGIPVPITL